MRAFYIMFYQKGKTYYFVGRDGTIWSTNNPMSDSETWHKMATYNGKGFRRVRLQGKTFKVHRVVAENFVDNPDNLPYVLHKDGDRDNNHYTNLEWSARQSNHLSRGQSLDMPGTCPLDR